MAVTGKDIVSEARDWLGTRFHHQGRVKATAQHAGGCDCIGLIVGVAKALKLKVSTPNGVCDLAMLDQQDYSRYPDGHRLKEILDKYFYPMHVDDAQEGDVALFYFDKNPQHVAIIGDYADGELSLIHCYARVRRVIEHQFDQSWRQRCVGIYHIL